MITRKSSASITRADLVAEGGLRRSSIGFFFSLYCYLSPSIGSSLIVPFSGLEWDLGIWYLPVMTLVVMFIINSANLQDGLDGLLASVSAVGSIAWSVDRHAVADDDRCFAVVSPTASAFYASALRFAGSLIAFLRYNYHPCQGVYGRYRQHVLGAAMVGVSMLLRLPLLLLPIAFTMLMSSVSVIMQRAYFKLTHGKRIFKVSPIHYHFQKNGMNEPQIVAMYTAVRERLGILAVLSLPWL